MEHLSCSGCKYYRHDRCTDWTVSALLGGEALKDNENRKCYDPIDDQVDEGAESVEGEQS